MTIPGVSLVQNQATGTSPGPGQVGPRTGAHPLVEGSQGHRLGWIEPLPAISENGQPVVVDKGKQGQVVLKGVRKKSLGNPRGAL